MIYLVTQQILPPTDAYKIVSVEDSLKLLEPLRIVGLDTETKGLDPYTKELSLVQLGNYSFQVVIDTSTVDINFYKDYLESNRLFIGWNLKFDGKFLIHKHIILHNIWDGFIAEKLMYLGYPDGIHSMSLKSAGHNYLGIELDKSVRGKIIWSKVLSDDIVVYAANDVKYLAMIMEQQELILKTKDLLDACRFENKFVIPLAYTEYCGIKLDIGKWRAKMAKDNEKLAIATKNLNNWVCTNMTNSKFVEYDRQGDLFTGFSNGPICIINWNSPPQVIKLFKTLGFNLSKKDKKTGLIKDSVEETVIKPQKHLSTIVPIYLDYKEAAKVVSTYGQNFIDQINPVTHRMHTNFNQLGTDTGRLSSGGKDKVNHVDYINFQNFPSDAETRGAFVAEPDNMWISCDYCAQESRIIADLSNDKSMLDLFLTGCGDTHALVCKMSFPEIVGDTPVEEVKAKFHDLRNKTKSWVEFPINYGGNANTIHQHSGKSMEESQRIYDNYMKGFPGIASYQKHQCDYVMKHGYILLNKVFRHKAYIYDFKELMEEKKLFTRSFWDEYRDIPRVAGKKSPRNSRELQLVTQVSHYMGRKSSSERQAKDYECQGTGAAMFKLAMIYLWDYMLSHNLVYKVLIVAPVHDEINLEVPKSIVEEMTTVLSKCMQDAGAYFCKKLPIPAEAEVNTCWVH